MMPRRYSILCANANINGGQVNLNCGGGAAAAANAQDELAQTRELKLQVHDADLNVFADKHYRLIVAGGRYEGTTDGDGYLNETIPKDASVGQLTIWIDEYPEGTQLNWPIEISDDELLPSASIEGALLRLRSLGYFNGELVAELTPEAQIAVQQFQEDNELEISGELDEATAAKLSEVYGG
ncbi:MAG: peptidoglycan-binding protein [Deltaproteobacteria bacterium]|nr:peptidoglycan-binding protein [Deltaproteobacteria bacterium]